MFTRIAVNGQGLHELLTSREVQAMLDAKAQQVKQAADQAGLAVSGFPGDGPLPVNVSSNPEPHRARSLVSIDHPSGLDVESKHRLLVGSLDAAR